MRHDRSGRFLGDPVIPCTFFGCHLDSSGQRLNADSGSSAPVWPKDLAALLAELIGFGHRSSDRSSGTTFGAGHLTLISLSRPSYLTCHLYLLEIGIILPLGYLGISWVIGNRWAGAEKSSQFGQTPA